MITRVLHLSLLYTATLLLQGGRTQLIPNYNDEYDEYNDHGTVDVLYEDAYADTSENTDEDVDANMGGNVVHEVVIEVYDEPDSGPISFTEDSLDSVEYSGVDMDGAAEANDDSSPEIIGPVWDLPENYDDLGEYDTNDDGIYYDPGIIVVNEEEVDDSGPVVTVVPAPELLDPVSTTTEIVFVTPAADDWLNGPEVVDDYYYGGGGVYGSYGQQGGSLQDAAPLDAPVVDNDVGVQAVPGIGQLGIIDGGQLADRPAYDGDYNDDYGYNADAYNGDYDYNGDAYNDDYNDDDGNDGVVWDIPVGDDNGWHERPGFDPWVDPGIEQDETTAGTTLEVPSDTTETGEPSTTQVPSNEPDPVESSSTSISESSSTSVSVSVSVSVSTSVSSVSVLDPEDVSSGSTESDPTSSAGPDSTISVSETSSGGPGVLPGENDGPMGGPSAGGDGPGVLEPEPPTVSEPVVPTTLVPTTPPDGDDVGDNMGDDFPDKPPVDDYDDNHGNGDGNGYDVDDDIVHLTTVTQMHVTTVTLHPDETPPGPNHEYNYGGGQNVQPDYDGSGGDPPVYWVTVYVYGDGSTADVPPEQYNDYGNFDYDQVYGYNDGNGNDNVSDNDNDGGNDYDYGYDYGYGYQDEAPSDHITTIDYTHDGDDHYYHVPGNDVDESLSSQTDVLPNSDGTGRGISLPIAPSGIAITSIISDNTDLQIYSFARDDPDSIEPGDVTTSESVTEEPSSIELSTANVSRYSSSTLIGGPSNSSGSTGTDESGDSPRSTGTEEPSDSSGSTVMDKPGDFPGSTVTEGPGEPDGLGSSSEGSSTFTFYPLLNVSSEDRTANGTTGMGTTDSTSVSSTTSSHSTEVTSSWPEGHTSSSVHYEPSTRLEDSSTTHREESSSTGTENHPSSSSVSASSTSSETSSPAQTHTLTFVPYGAVSASESSSVAETTHGTTSGTTSEPSEESSSVTLNAVSYDEDVIITTSEHSPSDAVSSVDEHTEDRVTSESVGTHPIPNPFSVDEHAEDTVTSESVDTRTTPNPSYVTHYQYITATEIITLEPSSLSMSRVVVTISPVYTEVLDELKTEGELGREAERSVGNLISMVSSTLMYHNEFLVTKVMEGHTVVQNRFTTITLRSTSTILPDPKELAERSAKRRRRVGLGCGLGLGIPLVAAVALTTYFVFIRSRKVDSIDPEGKIVTSYKMNKFKRMWYMLLGKELPDYYADAPAADLEDDGSESGGHPAYGSRRSSRSVSSSSGGGVFNEKVEEPGAAALIGAAPVDPTATPTVHTTPAGFGTGVTASVVEDASTVSSESFAGPSPVESHPGYTGGFLYEDIPHDYYNYNHVSINDSSVEQRDTDGYLSSPNRVSRAGSSGVRTSLRTGSSSSNRYSNQDNVFSDAHAY